MKDTVSEVLSLFNEKGQSMYGGEAVTQLQHGLQAATAARSQGHLPHWLRLPCCTTLATCYTTCRPMPLTVVLMTIMKTWVPATCNSIFYLKYMSR